MPEITKKIDIASSVSEVWDVLASFESISDWADNGLILVFCLINLRG